MKKHLIIIGLCITCFSACANNNTSESEPEAIEKNSEEKLSTDDIIETEIPFLELTDEMINEINDEIDKTDNYIDAIDYLAYDEMYRIIMYSRLYDEDLVPADYTLADLKNEYTLDDFEITNTKKTDSYTYTIYGKLYYSDNYGRQTYTTAQVIYKVPEKYGKDGYKLDIYDDIYEFNLDTE